MAVVRLIFRPCVGNHPMGVRFAARNHPSGRSASSSPQGAPISHLMFALSATQTDGWFPVQNLKINRAKPSNEPMASHRPLQMICNVCAANAPRSTTMIHDSLLFILSSASNSSLLIASAPNFNPLTERFAVTLWIPQQN